MVIPIFDLIPLAGATIATIIVATVVFIETDWVRCLIVIAAFIGYQQSENHVLQPLVYGRTLKLSPLAVLCAVLIGAQLAGILGALLAIPVAASLLAIRRELLEYRKELADAGEPEPELELLLAHDDLAAFGPDPRAPSRQHGRVPTVRRRAVSRSPSRARRDRDERVRRRSIGAPAWLDGVQDVRGCRPVLADDTLAVNGSTAWVACKERSQVLKVATRTGRSCAPSASTPR